MFATKGQAILVHTLLCFVYHAPDAQSLHWLDKKFTNLCSVLEIYFKSNVKSYVSFYMFLKEVKSTLNYNNTE